MKHELNPLIAARQLGKLTRLRPTLAIVLGSGFHEAAAKMKVEAEISYQKLAGFPRAGVSGHAGKLMLGHLGGTPVLVLNGRSHYYEGHSMEQVTFPVRVLAEFGIRDLLLTNAAGGIDPTLAPGEIVAIADHLNLTGTSALSGPNDERLGPRFVDMTDAYSPALRALAALSAPAALGRPLREAVYAGVAGPAYETPAEVRMLRTLGAGLVGMSTVHEVTTARHAGLAVLGLSLVSNHAAGVKNEPLRHEDVTRAASAGADAMARLVGAIIAGLR